jgi:hemolysin activation/secretion protein
MNRVSSTLALCGAASLVAATSALAQSSPLIVDGQRVDRAPPSAPSPAPPKQARGAAAAVSANIPAGLVVHSVEVAGSSAPAQLVGGASRPFIGKPLDKAALNAIAQAISAAYARTDVALYTVEVPAQDFAGGVVRVRVIEGYVEHVFLTGPGAKGDQRELTSYATRLTREHPLRRSTLERYLSLIRDIPGLKVDPKLVTGSREGAVRLMLDLKRQTVQVGISVDDRGTNALGRDQLTLETDFNSLVRQGDQTQLVFATPTDFEQFRYVSVSHSEPIGSDGLVATAQAAYLETRPNDSPIRGDVVTGAVRLTYPVIRSYTRNLYIAGEFDVLNSDNGAFGAVITSEHTRVARATASYSKTGAKQSWSAAVTVSQGVNGLGARVAPGDGSAAFSKLNAQAALDQALGKRVTLRLRAISQAAGNALPVSEAFSLGGDQFGRAFPAAYVLGDSGAAGSAELAWRPNQPIRRLDGSELYGFVDGGEADARSRLGLPGASYTLASAGGGVRFAVSKRAVFTVEAAKSLKSPYPDTPEPWRLILGWRGAY